MTTHPVQYLDFVDHRHVRSKYTPVGISTKTFFGNIFTRYFLDHILLFWFRVYTFSGDYSSGTIFGRFNICALLIDHVLMFFFSGAYNV